MKLRSFLSMQEKVAIYWRKIFLFKDKVKENLHRGILIGTKIENAIA